MNLTSLGLIHTLIALVALAAALVCFVRDRRIDPGTGMGKLYVVMTVLTCLTGFGIFQHGGFGKPHALGILTLLVLGLAYVARNTTLLGAVAAKVETVALTTTVFFHFIPGITETSTRLPVGAPLLPNADAPELKVATGILFLFFAAVAAWQVRSLHAGAALPPAGGLPRTD